MAHADLGPSGILLFTIQQMIKACSEAKKGARVLAQCAWGTRFDLQRYGVHTPNTWDEDKARSN